MRVIRVKFQVPGTTTLETFYVQGNHGRFRRIAAPHEHDVPPNPTELRAWFKRLGVTHVEVCYGNGPSVEMPDGVHRASKWLSWAQQMDDEACA